MIDSMTGIAILRISFFLQSLITAANTLIISKILFLSSINKSNVYNAALSISGLGTLRMMASILSRIPSMKPPAYI